VRDLMKFIFVLLSSFVLFIQISFASENSQSLTFEVKCLYNYEIKGSKYSNIGNPIHLGQFSVEFGGAAVSGILLDDENLKLVANINFSNGSPVGVAKAYFHLSTCVSLTPSSDLS